MALFKFISQAFSWAITIIIARILVPDDYGLMTMACIITGYAEIFSELGLGAAIIQKKDTSKSELSSVFWFTLFFSALLAVSCFPVAHFTAYILNEPRVVPLTQTVSIIFIFSGLRIVPVNLLKKDLDFKSVGLMEMTSTIISCTGMLFIAYIGGGVWALLLGRIIRSITMVGLVYYKVKWLPKLHFSFNEAKSYIRFGLTMSFGRSLFYIWENSDKFFAGRAWSANTLGYYTFALQLAQIPTEKIVTLINQVSFPAFARLQNDKERFNTFYLNIIKVTATLVLPLFVGGYLVGEEIVKILLNEKWYPIIFLFKYLCLTQIFTALNAVNNFAHAAQGRPHWGLCYHMVCAVLMPVSFFFAVKYGLNAIIIPWFTTFVVICSGWILITIKKIGVGLNEYLHVLMVPFAAVILMASGVISVKYFITISNISGGGFIYQLLLSVLCGAIVYGAFLWIFDKQLLRELKALKKA